MRCSFNRVHVVMYRKDLVNCIQTKHRKKLFLHNMYRLVWLHEKIHNNASILHNCRVLVDL